MKPCKKPLKDWNQDKEVNKLTDFYKKGLLTKEKLNGLTKKAKLKEEIQSPKDEPAFYKE